MAIDPPMEDRAPDRSIWCVWGIAALFLLPAATFLFSWYSPYLPDAFSLPAVSIVLTLLVVVALPILIWIRASKVGRRRWLWAGLTLMGSALRLVHPLASVVGALPAFAYAVTGLTNRTRRTSTRDAKMSWALLALGTPLGFFVCWLAFDVAYIPPIALGPPPFISVQPTYVISLKADLSRVAPDERGEVLSNSLGTMLRRLKEYSPGVISTTVGADTISIGLSKIRDPERTIELVSSPGLLELVDIGELPLTVGTALPIPHHTVVSGKDIRLARDWNGEWVADGAAISLDQYGRPVLKLEFAGDGAKMLRDFTSTNIGKYVALTMDNVVVVSPVITSPIPDGQLVVSGFSFEQAQLIVLKVKYGVLLTSFATVSTNPISPPHK